jgi:hypothetical protein
MSEVIAPTANLPEAVEFLTGIGCGEPEHLAVHNEADGMVVRTVEPDAIGEGVRQLARYQGTHNCWYHANPISRDVRNKKAHKGQVLFIRMLHVDVDDREALDRIAAYSLPPSVVVDTGGGFQCLWLLKEPLYDVPRAEALNKRIARDLGGDNCSSADHLLRIAGTVNALNTKKRIAGRKPARAFLLHELTDFGRRYTIEDCERVLGAGLAVLSAERPDMAPIILHTAESLAIEVPEPILALISSGDDPERPMSGRDARYPSRSEAVYRVACELARAGADEGIIAGVLLNPLNGISRSILEKRDPEKYARRQASQALRTVGTEWPDVGRNKVPIASFHNALVGLVRLGLTFMHDQFRNRNYVNGFQLQELTGELNDDLCAVVRHEFLKRHGFDPTKEHVRDAAQTLCLENTIHPIREYLDSLQWDGVSRLERWLAVYMGAEDTPFHRAVGRLTLIAAVRRVREPGVKFDNILVFEGPQGSGKSTAVSILPGDAFFSDQDLLTADTKAQIELIEGIWIFEISELQGLGRAEIDRVKAFASRRFDRTRPAYGRFREDRPRQTIFIGTTNDDQYLRDQTGNRRFWPVLTSQVDLVALRKDRDQLWAEAALAEAQGASLTLPEDLWEAAREAQDARVLDDPWLDDLANARGKVESGWERITTAQALATLEMSAERKNPAHAKRIVVLMRRLGWDGPKSIRVKGRRGVFRGYERPNDGPDTFDVDEPFGRGGLPDPEPPRPPQPPKPPQPPEPPEPPEPPDPSNPTDVAV